MLPLAEKHRLILQLINSTHDELVEEREELGERLGSDAGILPAKKVFRFTKHVIFKIRI